MKILLFLFLCASARAELVMEVQRTNAGPSSVVVRVTGGEPNPVWYWIERSDDQGKTWDDYIRAYSGEWYWITENKKSSWFRARAQ